MCTSIVHKGRDLIVGFNFDLCEGAFKYGVYKRRDMFFIGITVGSTTYKTHGVNANGNTGCLPYMNGVPETVLHRGAKYRRLDILNDRFIAGKLSYPELLREVKEKTIVNLPGMSMHSQLTDREGRILIVEPGSGYREVEGNCSIISNFPFINRPSDMSNPYFGADRFEKGEALLRAAGDGFSVSDALELLKAVSQDEPYATRVSYVYSANDNAVYYVLGQDFDRVQKHTFG